MSLNKAMLIGNLGADPEIRRTQDGKPIASFSLATNEKWRDKHTGERRERVEWHRIVVFGEGLCGIVERYLTKGDPVYVEGKIQTRKWQDQSGQDRYSTEIVLQGFDGRLQLLGGARSGSRPSGPDDYGTEKPSTPHPPDPGMDDEIPF